MVLRSWEPDEFRGRTFQFLPALPSIDPSGDPTIEVNCLLRFLVCPTGTFTEVARRVSPLDSAGEERTRHFGLQQAAPPIRGQASGRKPHFYCHGDQSTASPRDPTHSCILSIVLFMFQFCQFRGSWQSGLFQLCITSYFEAVRLV